MKHPSKRYLTRSCLCIVLLPLALSSVASTGAQTPSPALLELQSCGRTLAVFADRTVVETFAGSQTRRQLSEKQMSKLRKVIATDPCEQQQQSARRKNSSPEPSQGTMTLLSSDNACVGSVLGYAPGLLEVFVTRHYPGRNQSMVVYIPCGHDAFARKHVNPKWQRYLYNVVDALGGKSIIEACHCG